MIWLYKSSDSEKSRSSIITATEYKNSPASKNSPDWAISLEKLIEAEITSFIDLLRSTGSSILLILDSEALIFSKNSA